MDSVLIPKRVSLLREFAEIGSKAGLAFIAACYVVGFLIVNLHLRKFGITYLGFLRTEYIIAGFVWAFLVALVYSLVALLFYRLRDLIRHRKFSGLASSLVWLILILFGLGFFPFSALNVVTQRQTAIASSWGWRTIGILLLNAGVLFSISNIKSFVGSDQKGLPKLDVRTYRWYWAFVCFYFAVTLVGSISLYSNYVFPLISSTFAGGSTQNVIFVIKGDQLDSAKSAGLQLSEDRKTTVEIIFEAPDFFLITPTIGTGEKVKAIRIRKDLIDAILYRNNQPD